MKTLRYGLFLVLCLSSKAFATFDYVYVRIPKAQVTESFVSETQFNIDHKFSKDYAFGYLTRSTYNALRSQRRVDIVELDEARLRTLDFDPMTLLSRLEDTLRLTDDVREGYHDYEQLTNELQLLARTFPERAQVYSIGKSIENRELWVIKISNDVSVDTPAKPKLLYISSMHGDEVAGKEMMIYLARKLLREYGTNERVTHLLDNSQIFIMPLMNPDGNARKQRWNAHGVDLNRDFPDFTSDPVNTTEGRAPETAAVMEFHKKHHFALSLNFHGGEVCFNLPWDTMPNESPSTKFGDDALIHALGREYADHNATMYANNNFDNGVTYGFEWYEVNGGMQDWTIHYSASTHATVELSYSKWPTASKLPAIWAENEEALLSFLEKGLHGVHLHVTDTRGRPLSAYTVKVSSSRRPMTFTTPYASRPTPLGKQTVSVIAPGYQEATVELNPWSLKQDYEKITLRRN